MSHRDELVRAAESGAGAEPAPRPVTALSDDAVIILAVRETVVFPGTVFPVTIGREASILAAQQALREERPIGVLMQREAEVAEPSALDLHRIGTMANILSYVNTPDGNHHLVLQGEQQFSVVAFVRERPYFAAACSASSSRKN